MTAADGVSDPGTMLTVTTPRTWQIPGQPDDVSCVTDRHGIEWKYANDHCPLWCHVDGLAHHHASWGVLLERGTLTERGKP